MAKISVTNPEAVVKEAYWLAWQACGGPLGMGVFQDQPGADREAVWAQMYDRADYSGNHGENRPGRVYGDYVFGRMMKLGLAWGEDYVEVSELAPRPDYQSWCRTYPTHAALIEAAVASLAAAHPLPA